MQKDLKKIGARIYLDESDMLIQKVTYIYEDETESEPLSRFIHPFKILLSIQQKASTHMMM